MAKEYVNGNGNTIFTNNKLKKVPPGYKCKKCGKRKCVCKKKKVEVKKEKK